MEYICETKVLSPQPVLSMRGRTTVAQIPETIGRFLGEVWTYAQANGGQMTGPPFTRYHAIEGDGIDLEAGMPVARALPGDSAVVPGDLPGGEVVATWHIGPYDRLPDAGAALAAWIDEHGRRAAGPNWETYWTDPTQVPDQSAWKTEVLKPLLPA